MVLPVQAHIRKLRSNNHDQNLILKVRTVAQFGFYIQNSATL
jgi:hypothetical protein